MDMCILHLSASAAICKNGSVTDWYQSHVIENKFETLTITTFLFPSKKVLCAAISSGIGKALVRHEEQIEEILNHLGELSLDRIKHIEDKVKGLRKGRVIIQQDFDIMEAELQQAHAQITKLQRKQIGSNHKISLAYFRITELGDIINDMRIHHQVDVENLQDSINELKNLFSRSRCAEENKVTFATGTLTDDALSWWNAYAQPMRVEQANQITWTELKRLLTNKYCPRTEVRKMEEELYNLTVKGNDLKPYVRRFQELTVICPNMMPNTEKLLEAFIGGLPQSNKGNVTASKPQTLKEAINIAQRLMDQVTKHTLVQVSNDHKRKFDERRTFNNNNNSRNNNYRNTNTNKRYNNHQPQQNRRQEAVRAYDSTPSENNRKRTFYKALLKEPTSMPEGRAYLLRDRNAHQDPNVVTGMFLLNQHLARVLFDSGADRSFISISLAFMLNIPSITIDTFYNLEMAGGNLVSTNISIKGCTLTLLNQPFEINIMPIKLGSFDVVIGMDW
ncbi:reverse transcriptase domain-containing protein [Tanacetum coccineum]